MVTCDPGKITMESFAAGEAKLDCFIDQEDYDLSPWITPSLTGVISATVLSTETVEGGTKF
jgi:hypothetical protein